MIKKMIACLIYVATLGFMCDCAIANVTEVVCSSKHISAEDKRSSVVCTMKIRSSTLEKICGDEDYEKLLDYQKAYKKRIEDKSRSDRVQWANALQKPTRYPFCLSRLEFDKRTSSDRMKQYIEKFRIEGDEE